MRKAIRILSIMLLIMIPMCALAETEITSLPINFDEELLAKLIVVGKDIPADNTFYLESEYDSRYPSEGILNDRFPNAYVYMEGWWIEDPDMSEQQPGQRELYAGDWGSTHSGSPVAYGTGKFVNGHKYAIAFEIHPREGYTLNMNTVELNGVNSEDIILRIPIGENSGGGVIINLGTVEDIQNALGHDAPKTGDTSTPVLYAFLVVLGVVGFTLLRRKETR